MLRPGMGARGTLLAATSAWRKAPGPDRGMGMVPGSTPSLWLCTTRTLTTWYVRSRGRNTKTKNKKQKIMMMLLHRCAEGIVYSKYPHTHTHTCCGRVLTPTHVRKHAVQHGYVRKKCAFLCVKLRLTACFCILCRVGQLPPSEALSRWSSWSF